VGEEEPNQLSSLSSSVQVISGLCH